VQRKVWREAQTFQAGRDAGGALLTGACGDGCAPLPGMLGGGAVPPEMNQLWFRWSQVYASDPQSPYEHVFPAVAQRLPCAGASFGQPSVRAA